MSLLHRIVLASFLLWPLVSNLQAQSADGSREVRDVYVTLVMIDIDEIDSVAQNFSSTVYAELSWHDPGLAHEGPDSISKKLDEIWYPRTQILNQQRLVHTFPPSAEVRPDGEVIFRQRVWGDFSQALELHQFPFDKQRLNITLVNVGFGSRAVRYHIRPESGISDALRIPDWNVLNSEVVATELPLGHEGTNVPAVVLSLDVERYASYFTLKVILPLILIVFMSWMVFWIDPSLAASQISVAVTAMLTLIAYRFAIGGMVPRLDFLTSMDYFVMGSTILVFFSLLEVIYTARLSQSGQLDKARSVDRHARWIAPLIYAAVVIETLYLRIGL